MPTGAVPTGAADPTLDPRVSVPIATDSTVTDQFAADIPDPAALPGSTPADQAAGEAVVSEPGNGAVTAAEHAGAPERTTSGSGRPTAPADEGVGRGCDAVAGGSRLSLSRHRPAVVRFRQSRVRTSRRDLP